MIQRAGPGAQSAPNTRINTIAGGVFGLLLGGIIVLLLELLDDTIKTRDDIERYIGREMLFLGQVPPK